MLLQTLGEKDRKRIIDLLERGARVIGLRICMHDISYRIRLPKTWTCHDNKPCAEVRKTHQAECTKFCGRKIERDMIGLPEGSIHTCPFGHTDITAPVQANGVLAGILYASSCWTGKGEPPRNGLVVPPSKEWLEDRRLALCGLAKKMEDLLREENRDNSVSRRDMITDYLNRNFEKPLRVTDLAKHISLSASRTGHLLKDIFRETFPQILTRIRLTHAARTLTITDLPTGEIAYDTGFSDQSHFTRAFAKFYGITPLAYRKKNKADV
ncbi:MAG: helix-turn-helix transcriptional regulator [Planctomycetes bacterium]|nr:helix-turn-helix transcriptional regulator [Planctomycetota bacterium]